MFVALALAVLLGDSTSGRGRVATYRAWPLPETHAVRQPSLGAATLERLTPLGVFTAPIHAKDDGMWWKFPASWLRRTTISAEG